MHIARAAGANEERSRAALKEQPKARQECPKSNVEVDTVQRIKD
jgi:hypothetical protein